MSNADDRARVRKLMVGLQWGAVALAIIAYAAATAGSLVFDDIHSVATNWVLQDTANWWRWISDPTAFSELGSMFRPVVLVSLGLNFTVSDGAFALKAGNVLLHALVVFLAFGWFRRLGTPLWGTFAAMALFAVHPLVSEAVNMVSARSELLLFVGLIIALRSQLAYCRGGALLKALGGIALGTVIACGSKETGVVLPGLMIAQAFFARRGPWGRVEWRRLGATVLPAIALVLVYVLLRKVLLGEATVQLSGRTGTDPLSGHGRMLVTQLATMGLLLPRALLQMVWPVGLTLDPEIHFYHTFANPSVLVGWGSVLGLAAIAMLPGPSAGRRRLGVTMITAVALPWIVIPLNMPLAEHRLYGPLLGFLLVVQPWLPRPNVRPFAFTGLVLLGVALSTLRSLDFRNEVRLWQAELVHSSSWRTWWGVGAAHMRVFDFAAAVEPLAEAAVRNGNNAIVLRNYAEALSQLPDHAAEPYRALVATDRYLAIRPDDPWARSLSAQAHLQAGRVLGVREWFAEAERIVLSCLEVGEPKGLVFRIAAAARQGMNDDQGALLHLDRSMEMGLDHVSVRMDRVTVLRALGRDREAHRELVRAQQEAPMHPAVMNALRSSQPPR